ncbi:MAG: hypothetical protein JSR47_11345 [Proteobacteria bacterium]|nr:hypothetical protein [Pseudomonadota bacterium]
MPKSDIELEIEWLEFTLRMVDEQLKHVVDRMTDALVLPGGIVDAALVKRHEALTTKTDRILDMITTMRKKMAAGK